MAAAGAAASTLSDTATGVVSGVPSCTVPDPLSGTTGAAAAAAIDGGSARGKDTSGSEGGADAAASCVTCEQPAPLLLLLLPMRLAVVALLGVGIRCLVMRAMGASARADTPSRTLPPDAVTLALTRPGPLALTEQPASSEVITAETHRLTTLAAPEVTVVEFLDFECLACRDWQPVMSPLAERYGDRVEFAFRHLPLPMHGNAITAALALEGAAEQGETVAMYERLFQTQSEWGGAEPETQADRFRGYAEELGVSSTPTFIVDGEINQLTSFDQLEELIVRTLDD